VCVCVEHFWNMHLLKFYEQACIEVYTVYVYIAGVYTVFVYIAGYICLYIYMYIYICVSTYMYGYVYALHVYLHTHTRVDAHYYFRVHHDCVCTYNQDGTSACFIQLCECLIVLLACLHVSTNIRV